MLSQKTLVFLSYDIQKRPPEKGRKKSMAKGSTTARVSQEDRQNKAAQVAAEKQRTALEKRRAKFLNSEKYEVKRFKRDDGKTWLSIKPIGGKRWNTYCEHFFRSGRCNICGSDALCPVTGKRKDQCPCDRDGCGNSLCPVNKMNKSFCDCGRDGCGAGLCPQTKKQKQHCNCGRQGCGAALCQHGKRKQQCTECLSLNEIIDSDIMCTICAEHGLSPARIRIGKLTGLKICARCDKTKKMRTEEVVKTLLLPLVDHEPSAADDVLFGADECDNYKRRRPDLLWVSEDKTKFIELEIDENGGHPERDVSCEIGKISDQADACAQLAGRVPNLYVLRFNPDMADGTPLDERIKVVAARLNELFTTPFDPAMLLPQVEYYYYHEKCHFQIEAALARPKFITVGRCIPGPLRQNRLE